MTILIRLNAIVALAEWRGGTKFYLSHGLRVIDPAVSLLDTEARVQKAFNEVGPFFGVKDGMVETVPFYSSSEDVADIAGAPKRKEGE